MAKDHGSGVKDDKQYEGLRTKGMSSHARRISIFEHDREPSCRRPPSSSTGSTARGAPKPLRRRLAANQPPEI